MNKKNWKQRFTDEFGIHFSASELQFALAFIEEEIEDAVNKAKEAERKEYRESIIPALCEDARRRERDRIWHEHLGLGKDIREVLGKQ